MRAKDRQRLIEDDAIQKYFHEIAALIDSDFDAVGGGHGIQSDLIPHQSESRIVFNW
jgi:hypothetical protein